MPMWAEAPLGFKTSFLRGDPFPFSLLLTMFRSQPRALSDRLPPGPISLLRLVSGIKGMIRQMIIRVCRGTNNYFVTLSTSMSVVFFATKISD
jgi:hypothetical protein